MGKSSIITDPSTGSKVFVKRHLLIPNNVRYTKEEVETLKRIQHKNVLPPLEVIEGVDSLYAVYKYCECIDLRDYIIQKEKLTEEETKELVVQIIDGYEELLNNGLLHNKLTPTNLLINFDGHPVIRLTDMNLLRKASLEDGEDLYLPHDMNRGVRLFCHLNEVWSIGALTYYMLHGEAQVDGFSEYMVDENTWRIELSANCKQFLVGCLQNCATMRLTFDEAKKHPFITGKETMGKKIPNEDVGEHLRKSKHFIKFFQDDLYVCYCEKGRDTIFECGHSSCVPVSYTHLTLPTICSV
eukprot:TRINITY_DN13994_c0_g2_i2.p1 TRINITY_DN13994_c0_g2~~TRINITY_DN13994_c0_g2_i2.p1  ORF type:complete len:307 (-),score=74.28 TRINITY_DN13994_c0_g2_i2:44-937(-)